MMARVHCVVIKHPILEDIGSVLIVMFPIFAKADVRAILQHVLNNKFREITAV